MASGDSHVTLINNTIVYNESSVQGGGVSTQGDEAAIISGKNNILYFNISSDDSQYAAVWGGGEINLTYSCISQELVAVGNMMDDPLFLNPEENDFILTEDSPCIDAGNPDSLYYDVEDPANPGFALYPALGTIINDMGVYGGHNNYEPPVNVDEKLIISQSIINLSNYPNPFNPITNIAYSIIDAGNVTLEVYNLRGQLVKTLVNEVKDTGSYSVSWDGTNDSGKSVSSGVYFYQLKAGKYTSTKKMILMK